MRRRPVMVVVIIVTLTLFLSGCEKEKEASEIEEISLEETAESGETEEEDLSGETQEEDTEESGEEPGSMCAARWQLRVSTNCPEAPGCTRPSRWPAALLRGPARRV